ncbi:hypothetical protein LEMLEM_LOCUS17426 [Lemmus lemmus]
MQSSDFWELPAPWVKELEMRVLYSRSYRAEFAHVSPKNYKAIRELSRSTIHLKRIFVCDLFQGELHDLVTHYQPQLRSPTAIDFTSLGLPFCFVQYYYAVLVTFSWLFTATVQISAFWSILMALVYRSMSSQAAASMCSLRSRSAPDV